MPAPVKSAKGKKRVKKTRTYIDPKGYLVNEEYSSEEEVEHTAPIKHEIKSEHAKKKPNQSQNKGATKAQASLASFFGKK